MKGTATIMINRPIEKVFSFITDVQNNDRWVDGASETKLISEESVGIGSIFEGNYMYSGKTHEIGYEVVNFSPPYQFGVKSTYGPFPFENLLDLKDVDGQTAITNNINAGSDHILTSITFILLKPLLRRQMNKQMKKELDNLKTILESELDS
ncbi:hypothetical protein CEE45_13550 [Candidatus Heimdallarchaeota archaeon B3_Heim]|nr:MAG: hypothetical protein CEE45_13550 [Candidatus Heimdallarchaeota archaeon B3_Heim]